MNCKAAFASMLCSVAVLAGSALAATPTLHIQADKTVVKVSPTLYGLMTEEINYSYDGGLYAELIRNRNFKQNLAKPDHWSLLQPEGGKSTMSLDVGLPLSLALPVSLKLDAVNVPKDQRVAIANEGYWGIPVRPSTTYKASFYAKCSVFGAKGPLTVGIESNDGKTIYASAEVPQLTTDWKQYSVTLTTAGDIKESANNRFVISTAGAGTYWFNLVSLFPPTYHDQPNGFRPDLMKMLVEMHPSFLRFPGGNYLEGATIEERFDWKNTIGPLIRRPGHPSPWHYESTDGMGLLEYLEWCEDMHAQPVLAVFAGYALHRQYVPPGPELQLFVQEALDEIEYITGDASTKWGAQRAADGHPAPFPLKYVEIGNEDWFDRSHSYDGRFAQFYDAIKAKYPKLQLIATYKVKSRTPDLIDEHFYKKAAQFEQITHRYDSYDRKGPKIFVGEWATREGEPTTNFGAALGDAAWMTGLERNSDVVVMACYAPLFVNVNPGGMQWHSDLIGYDTLHCFGSPSYYAQKMFKAYLGDSVPESSIRDVPTRMLPPARASRNHPAQAQPTAVDTLFYSVTRNSETGSLYIKLVNTSDKPQPVHLAIDGATLADTGTQVVLTSAKSADTNSITDPTHITPITTALAGVSNHFSPTLAPLSITVLQLNTATGSLSAAPAH